MLLISKSARVLASHTLGTPEDIANVVTYLASEEGGWINGQVIRANGGMD